MTIPGVSVIVPCYNEAQTILILMEAIYHQNYPRQALEVIIADGMSTDETRQVISQFQTNFPDLAIRIIDNPKRIIPAALNCAIRAASKEFIIRVDAHSQPYPDYIEKSILALQEGKGDNVGGIWEIQPLHRTGESASPTRRGIAAAAAHPLGVGDALYRYASTPHLVDTVPFGAFRKSTALEIGLFNESLRTNEDYEFNVRIRKNGGKIWLDPNIRCVYYARPTYSALFKQYWRYGYWKARMLMLSPGTIRWRQALPPLFVFSLAVLLGLAVWVPLARGLLLAQLASYITILTGIGVLTTIKKRDATILFTMPIAIAVMHLSWGTAFLWSLVSALIGNQSLLKER